MWKIVGIRDPQSEIYILIIFAVKIIYGELSSFPIMFKKVQLKSYCQLGHFNEPKLCRETRIFSRNSSTMGKSLLERHTFYVVCFLLASAFGQWICLVWAIWATLCSQCALTLSAPVPLLICGFIWSVQFSVTVSLWNSAQWPLLLAGFGASPVASIAAPRPRHLLHWVLLSVNGFLYLSFPLDCELPEGRNCGGSLVCSPIAKITLPSA